MACFIFVSRLLAYAFFLITKRKYWPTSVLSRLRGITDNLDVTLTVIRCFNYIPFRLIYHTNERFDRTKQITKLERGTTKQNFR